MTRADLATLARATLESGGSYRGAVAAMVGAMRAAGERPVDEILMSAIREAAAGPPRYAKIP